MKAIEQAIAGVYLIQPTRFEDERGHFSELWRESALAELIGQPLHFVQENESVSRFGVLRGLHFQIAPFAQAKLIRVLQGRVLDVAVDLRIESQTYGQHIALELDAENGELLFLPKGVAHGFVVLSDSARVNYKTDAYYSPDHERGVRYDDPTLAIDWALPAEQLIVSARDQALPFLSDDIKNLSF